MQYTVKTESYNERRYGKPWKAIVNDSLTRNFTFVDWNGRPGRDGEFNFTVEPGTILASGQKDIRKGRGGVDNYEIAMPDGSLPHITDAHVLALLKMPVSDRVVEAARLLIAHAEASIAEIAEEKRAEPYYAELITKATRRIVRFRKFLPEQAMAAHDADYYLDGGV